MSKNYTLTVKNKSQDYGNVCIYQTTPNQNRNLYSLAWLCKACPPGASATLSWGTDYCFCWSYCDRPNPRTVFIIEVQRHADPEDPDKNAVRFSREKGDNLFTPATGLLGNLGIYMDKSIVHYEAAVGIVMSAKIAFAAMSTPNYNITFSPHPDYWVVFGSYQEGELLNFFEYPEGAFHLEYPTNVYDKTIVLHENNTWSEQ